MDFCMTGETGFPEVDFTYEINEPLNFSYKINPKNKSGLFVEGGQNGRSSVDFIVYVWICSSRDMNRSSFRVSDASKGCL